MIFVPAGTPPDLFGDPADYQRIECECGHLNPVPSDPTDPVVCQLCGRVICEGTPEPDPFEDRRAF